MRTTAVGVQEGHDARSYSQAGAFDAGERDMAGVIWRRPVEHGKGPARG